MEKRKLGNSDFSISEISFGCMSLPTDFNEAQKIIETAVDNGINYFDTADLYDKGINEEIVGKALKPYRKDVYIATKVGNRWNEDGNGWFWDASPKHIENGLKMSLKRLGTDYIDLYQLHGGTIDDSWEEIIDTFEKLKKEGYIREYGISSIRPNVFVSFLNNSKAVSIMMQYSILDRRPEEWFNEIEHTNASIVTRGTVAKGLLTNEWRKRIEQVKGYLDYSKEELLEVLETIEKEFGNVHPAAIAFNLRNPLITSTVIGARNTQQLLENIRAYEQSKQLQNVSILEQITKQTYYTDHR